MPFFLKFSLSMMLACLAVGQFWLHDEASPSSIVAARDAVEGCPAVGRVRTISTSWDVIRAEDAVRIRRIAEAVGIGRGC